MWNPPQYGLESGHKRGVAAQRTDQGQTKQPTKGLQTAGIGGRITKSYNTLSFISVPFMITEVFFCISFKVSIMSNIDGGKRQCNIEWYELLYIIRILIKGSHYSDVARLHSRGGTSAL